MIILMALMFFTLGVMGAYTGFKATEIVLDLNYQRMMNSLRRDIGLNTKPYAVNFKKSLV